MSVNSQLKRVAPFMEIAVLTNDVSPLLAECCRKTDAFCFFDKSTEFEKVLALVHEQPLAHR